MEFTVKIGDEQIGSDQNPEQPASTAVRCLTKLPTRRHSVAERPLMCRPCLSESPATHRCSELFRASEVWHPTGSPIPINELVTFVNRRLLAVRTF